MKKFFILLVVIILAITATGGLVAYADSNETVVSNELTKARSAYLIDYNSGTVLYERNAEDKLPIASMVKIMTLVITFDNIKSGKLSLDEMIVVSENAAGMGGSQMFLDAGKEYSVRDLIKGITVCSANDASVALAERLCGDTDAFVAYMNDTAKSLGMNNTIFVNVTGLPQDGQYSTAKDVSIMMKKLLSNEEYYQFSKIFMEDYKHPDGRITQLVNTNKLIRFYKGCDAGKTGFTNAAMFCLSASAVRNDTRVIATVIGSPDSKSRFAEISNMFNYAYANTKQVKLIDKNDIIDSDIIVKNGKKKHIEIHAEENVYALEIKGKKEKFTIDVTVENAVKAPIKAGAVVGKVIIKREDGSTYKEVNIISKTDVDVMKYGDSIAEILRNWYFANHK